MEEFKTGIPPECNTENLDAIGDTGIAAPHKKKKKPLLTIISVVAVIAVAIAAWFIFCPSSDKNSGFDDAGMNYAYYVKDGDIYYISSTDKKGTKIDTSVHRLLQMGQITDVQSYMGIEISKDGKYLFYIDKEAGNRESSLYARELKNSGGKVVEISGLLQNMDYYVSDDNKVFYTAWEDGSTNLYMYDFKDTECIAEDMKYFKVSSDGNTVVYCVYNENYIRDEYDEPDIFDLYIKYKDEDAKLIDTEVKCFNRQMFEKVSADFDEIIYTKSDSIYKYTRDNGSEHITDGTIVSQGINYVNINNDLGFYYTKTDDSYERDGMTYSEGNLFYYDGEESVLVENDIDFINNEELIIWRSNSYQNFLKQECSELDSMAVAVYRKYDENESENCHYVTINGCAPVKLNTQYVAPLSASGYGMNGTQIVFDDKMDNIYYTDILGSTYRMEIKNDEIVSNECFIDGQILPNSYLRTSPDSIKAYAEKIKDGDGFGISSTATTCPYELKNIVYSDDGLMIYSDGKFQEISDDAENQPGFSLNIAMPSGDIYYMDGENNLYRYKAGKSQKIDSGVSALYY